MVFFLFVIVILFLSQFILFLLGAKSELPQTIPLSFLQNLFPLIDKVKEKNKAAIPDIRMFSKMIKKIKKNQKKIKNQKSKQIDRE